MLTRAITGFFFIATIISAIYFGAYSAAFLFLVIVLLGVDELFTMVKSSKTVHPLKIWGNLNGLVLISLAIPIAQQSLDAKFLAIPVAMLFFTFIIELYRKNEAPFLNISFTNLGVLYVVIPFAMLYHLGFYADYSFGKDFSYEIILGFFFILWMNDTGAYLAGRFFGKHKLFERISPKKTWEGSLGGGIFSIGLAIIIAQFFTNISLFDWIVISIIIVIFGGVGDLVESMLKRSLKIKDSGKLLPGHGGILDRFDGLLISAPFVYCYLQLIS